MTHITANIITIFPDMFPGPLGGSLAGRALDQGKWALNLVNLRDYGLGVHKMVDDRPFGGGAGMVLRPDVLDTAMQNIENPGRKIYLSPRGKTLDQNLVKDLSQESNLTLLCGRYEGVDQRFLDVHDFEEISIGDYVLGGGEVAAMVLLEACTRLLPGVMGNEDTAPNESFETGLLEHPHYTQPRQWVDGQGNSHDVPEILTGGHHKLIEDWRQNQSEEITQKRRPDLWAKYNKTAKK